MDVMLRLIGSIEYLQCWISYLTMPEKGGKRVFDIQKEGNPFVIPQSGVSGIGIEHLIPILTFFDNLK
jgi:hypothetical protein